MNYKKKLWGYFLLILILEGCGGQEKDTTPYFCNSASGICTPCEPKFAKRAYNKSYEIRGITYTPQPHYEISEVGTASYYGGTDIFHGRATSNGEIFDMNRISAAHKTLPIPCVVRVTNLENGRSLKVKINDRGPFIEGRVIDVSRKVAQLLGFYHKGTAKVHVETALPDTLMLVRGDLDDDALQLAEVSQRPEVSEALPFFQPRKTVRELPARKAPEGKPSATVVLARSPFYQADRALLQAKIDEALDSEATFEASPQLVSYESSRLKKSQRGYRARSDFTQGKAKHLPRGHTLKSSPLALQIPRVLGGSRGYFVQAETFKDPKAAHVLYQKLQKFLSPSHVKLEKVSFGPTKFFRVLIGPFRYAEEAKQLLKPVSLQSQSQPIVVYNG